MAKQMRGDVVTILMIIGGIVILLSVIVVGVFVYQSVRWGPCWANFNQNMGEIEKAFNKLKFQESSKVTVTMGECVGALVFANSENLKKIDSRFREELKCPEGKGFMIGLPADDETKSGWRFWLWPKDLWENVVRWWRGTGRDIGPLCKSVDKEIYASEDEVEGPGEGKTKTICLELVKIGENSYGVSYKGGSCG